jgi:hypothetical protein
MSPVDRSNYDYQLIFQLTLLHFNTFLCQGYTGPMCRVCEIDYVSVLGECIACEGGSVVVCVYPQTKVVSNLFFLFFPSHFHPHLDRMKKCGKTTTNMCWHGFMSPVPSLIQKSMN